MGFARPRATRRYSSTLARFAPAACRARDAILHSPAPALASELLVSHRFAAFEPGPRLVVTGAVHGNETCGTRAIERVLGELAAGTLAIERGIATFVPITNALAYERRRREGERNLNRGLRESAAPQDFEDRLANRLCPLLAEHDVLLDLHSYTAPGDPFVFLGPEDNAGVIEPFSRAAEEASLAAVVGPRRVVHGWLDTFARGVERRMARVAAGASIRPRNTDPHYGVGTTEYMRSRGGYALTVECAQHDDPRGPQVAYRAIRNTLAHLGMAAPLAGEVAPAAPIELLRIAEVFDRGDAADRFTRTWSSFDRVAAGEPIAVLASGEAIVAPQAGYVLFPNPDSEPGNEWFYLAVASTRRLAA